MTDGNPINVTLVYSPVSHNENFQLSPFSKLQNKLKPYTLDQESRFPVLDSKKPFISTVSKLAKPISTLASLISNPSILARVESNSSLRAAILANPTLADAIMNNPALLTAIIKSPGLLSALTNSSDISLAIKENPAILAELIKNPTLSIESILERLAKKTEPFSLPKGENISSKPHSLERSTIASEKARLPIKTLLSKIKFVSTEPLEIKKQQGARVVEKYLQAKPLINSPTTAALKTATNFDARLLTLNPSLLAALAAVAVVSNRGRVTVSGSLKDIGVELETQSESQPDAIQESDQIDGIGEVGEIHSVSEAAI